MRGLLSLPPFVTMNAATPEGTPLRRIGDVKLLRTCPPCLEETRGEGHRNIAYFFYLKNNFHGFDVTASIHAGFSGTKKNATEDR